jgi:anti-anti-sigma factor
MSYMAITSKTEGNKHTIIIQGRFDFNTQHDFRVAYEMIEPNNEFTVDFAGTDYIDSSALGMLLLLRDFAGGDSANIEFVNCRPEVKNIFEISNFQKLFTIK